MLPLSEKFSFLCDKTHTYHIFIRLQGVALVRTLLLLFSFIVNYHSIISLSMNSTCFLLVCLLAAAYPIEVIGPICSGKVNTNAIMRDEPRLVSTVSNGKRYVVGQGYDQINIVQVYGGTPYDMGFALGKLMSREFKQGIPEYFDYLDKKIESIMKSVPVVSVEFLYCCLE
jgi:hypothetical protein